MLFSSRSALRVKFAATATCLSLLAIPTSKPSHAGNLLAPIWTGAYIGFHGGANWADVGTTFSSTVSSSSFQGGGHIGYNIGLGGVLIGVEADASYDGSEFAFSTAGGGTGALSTDWSGTLRARAGLPVGPLLLYATAGYAWKDTALSERSVSGGSFSNSHTFDGVVYGAGLESYVFPNMSVRLEALRYDYSADKLSISGAKNSIQEIDPSDTVVRAGLTFHLN